MTTVAILPISNINGEKSYRAIAGDKQSTGKTAGQALDSLITQLGEADFFGMLIIQICQPDSNFLKELQSSENSK
jgi:hypothetical protein